jgi:uncharacterized protein (DUF305 family)
MKTTMLMIPLLALGAAGFKAKNPFIYASKAHLVTTVNTGVQQSDPLKESMNKMMKEMHGQQMKGNVDYDFASMLKIHHQGAIDMARIELQQGKDETMKKMAQKILTKQTKEVAQLNQLIAKLQTSAKNYDPSNKQSGAGKAMSDNMMEMMKSGMMSMSAVDHEFADMMTKHHKDGIMMAKAS